eukprot:2228414-Rhodomonas_salina.4
MRRREQEPAEAGERGGQEAGPGDDELGSEAGGGGEEEEGGGEKEAGEAGGGGVCRHGPVPPPEAM